MQIITITAGSTQTIEGTGIVNLTPTPVQITFDGLDTISVGTYTKIHRWFRTIKTDVDATLLILRSGEDIDIAKKRVNIENTVNTKIVNTPSVVISNTPSVSTDILKDVNIKGMKITGNAGDVFTIGEPFHSVTIVCFSGAVAFTTDTSETDTNKMGAITSGDTVTFYGDFADLKLQCLLNSTTVRVIWTN